METLYIVDPTNFNGTVYTTVRNGFVDYTSPSATLEEYLKQPGNESFEAVTWEQLEPLLAAYYNDCYLSHPAIEITEDEYMDALGCLPPTQWKRENGIESFWMSERTEGSITQQYATDGKRYICKYIDLAGNDRITADDFSNK